MSLLSLRSLSHLILRSRLSSFISEISDPQLKSLSLWLCHPPSALISHSLPVQKPKPQSSIPQIASLPVLCLNPKSSRLHSGDSASERTKAANSNCRTGPTPPFSLQKRPSARITQELVDLAKSNNYFHYKLKLPAERDVVSFLRTKNSVLMWSRSFSSDSGDLVDAVVPFMGESITDGTLAAFLKKPGDHVNIDEPIAQVETDKVTIDVASPETGVIQEFIAKEGDTVEPGTKIAIISKSGEGVTHVAPSDKAPNKAASEPAPAGKEKVEKQIPKAKTPPPKEKPKAPSVPPFRRSATEPQLPPKERERRVPMTRLRKRVATRLKDSQNTFALLTMFNDVDMTNLMNLRSDYKDAFLEKHGVKLGLMSGFVKPLLAGSRISQSLMLLLMGMTSYIKDYVMNALGPSQPNPHLNLAAAGLTPGFPLLCFQILSCKSMKATCHNSHNEGRPSILHVTILESGRGEG